MVERVANESGSAPEVQAINASLHGPVVDAIKRCVPEFRAFERDELYERVMNTPALADLCFKVFRANQGEFYAVMVGPNGAKVTGDDQKLSCGRTLAQVIALIVRAMTRRYLRATLDGADAAPLQPVGLGAGLVKRLAGRLGLNEARRGRGRNRRAHGRKTVSIGDQVYRALREFLLYEWQVSLIPDYAQIPVALAPHVAPYIVSARSPGAVRDLVAAAQGPALVPVSAQGGAETETNQQSRRGAKRHAGPDDWRQFQP